MSQELSHGWNGSMQSLSTEMSTAMDSSDDDFMLSTLQRKPKSSKKRRADVSSEPVNKQSTKKAATEKAMADKKSNMISDSTVTLPNSKSLTGKRKSANETDVLASDLQRKSDVPSQWNVQDDCDDIGSDLEEIALLKYVNLQICNAEEAELMKNLDNEILEAEFEALDNLTWERIKAAVTKYRVPGGRAMNVLYPMETMTPEQIRLDQDWDFHDAVQGWCFAVDVQKKLNEQLRKKQRGVFDVDNMGNTVIREVTMELPKYIGTSHNLVFTEEDIKWSMVQKLCQNARTDELSISLKDKEDDPYTVELKIKADESIIEIAKKFIENHIRTKQMGYLSLESNHRAKSTVASKVSGSRNLELYKRFVYKYEKIKDIDFGGIHAKSVTSSMWQKHKARYGPACGPGCHCPFELDVLTSTVIDDALKKLPNAERPREIGFSKWFAPKFMGLLRKEFPRETNATLFRRLIRMWESHLKQQRFGTSCRETCPCLEGWGPVFKKGHLEGSALRSKISASGTGILARRQEEDKFSERETPAQSGQKEYEVVFDTRRPLGFFCGTQNRVCKILSASPSVKDVRLNRGTIIVSVAMGRSSDWHPIRSHDELKAYYENFKRHVDGQWMKIRFINTDVKIESSNKRDNQWTASNAWRGNSNLQGWAGGATVVFTKEKRVAVAKDSRTVASSSTGTYSESSYSSSFPDKTINLNRSAHAPKFGSSDQNQIQPSGPSSKGTRSNQIVESRQTNHYDSVQQVRSIRPPASTDTHSRTTHQVQSTRPLSSVNSISSSIDASRQANQLGSIYQMVGLASSSSNDLHSQQFGASGHANHHGSPQQITVPASTTDVRNQQLEVSCDVKCFGSIQQNQSSSDTSTKPIGKGVEPNHRGAIQPRSIFKGASKFSKPQVAAQEQSMFRSLANVSKRSKPVLVRWAKEFESKVFDSHADASKSLKVSTSADTATLSGEQEQQVLLVAENSPSSSELLSAIAHKKCVDVFELLKAGADTRPKGANQLEVPEVFAKTIRDSLVAKLKHDPTDETQMKYADIIAKVNLLKIFHRARDVMANSACLKKWVRYEARIDRIENLRLTSATPHLPGDKFLCEIQIMGEIMGTAQQSNEWAESIEWPETKGARYKFYYNESLPDRYISGDRTLVVTFRKTIGNTLRTIDLASQTRQLDDIKSAVATTDMATMEIEMKPTACLESGRAVVVVRKLRDETMAKMNDKRDRYRKELKQLINDMKAFNADKRREAAGMPELDFNMRQPEAPHITPLHAAVYLNDVQLVTELIAYGADINAKSGKGISPRTLALMMNEVFSKDKDREKELKNSKKILELLGIHEDCDYAIGVDISTEDDEDDVELKLASPLEAGEDTVLLNEASHTGVGKICDLDKVFDRVEAGKDTVLLTKASHTRVVETFEDDGPVARGDMGPGNSTGSRWTANVLDNSPGQEELIPHSEQAGKSKKKMQSQRQLPDQALFMDLDDLPKMTLQRVAQGRPLCRFHNLPRGCKNGKMCSFMHLDYVNPKKTSVIHKIPSYRRANLKVATDMDSNGRSCYTALYRDENANVYLKASGGKTLGANRDGVYWYQNHEDAVESIENVIYLWRHPHLQVH